MKLLNVRELFELPEPEWLVQDFLPLPGLCLLYGPSGHGKSFVALDWGLCVAAGVPWLGEFPVQQGAVVYVACEGVGGLKKRVAAWLRHHKKRKDQDYIAFGLETVNFYDEEERQALLDALDDQYPIDVIQHPDTGEPTEFGPPLRLIVIDTLARVYRGDDENSTAQMSDFIRKIEVFAKDRGATVVLVHHSTKAKPGTERGSTALRGAMEACFSCLGRKRAGALDAITLTCDKQKDGPELAITLRTQDYELDELPRDAAGRVQQSTVLCFEGFVGVKDGDEGSLDQKILEAVELYPERSKSAVFSHVKGKSELFFARFGVLEDKGFVEMKLDAFRKPHWAVTETGQAFLNQGD